MGMKTLAFGLVVYIMLSCRSIRSMLMKPSRATSRVGLTMEFGSSNSDTVYALSSGTFSKTGVAVIRLSGPNAKFCLEQLTPAQTYPKPRMAALRSLVCPQSSDLLDKALCIWFPGPRSFTGEDCVELHVHGSKAVISGVFESLQHLDNPKEGVSIRPADRGEFTRRAFDNGKMDLTEVEGLADLLEADTSEQRKQALRQMNGNLRIQFEAWRGQLMKFLAHTEAVIDFGDDDREDDINDDAMWSLIPQVKELRSQLEVHLRDGRKGEIVREGVSVALVGPPNAGKSSLLNALAKRPAAIVSPIAGTTRDIVEVRLDLGGLPCIVSDTAGLREQTEDIIEKEGIKRAKNAFRSSQVKVFVRDASDPSSGDAVSTMLQDLLDPSTEESENLDEDEEDEFEYNQRNSKVILVTNKIDALETSIDPPSEVEDIANTLSGKDIAHLRISCETGEGISDLEGSIARAIRSLVESSDDESVLITRERHRRHLQQCVRHLDAFISGYLPMDAAAEELRLAMQELGRVTGRVDVEELLDIIFRDFCIGK